MIKKATFLCRRIDYSQRSHTLGKEEEKWTQFMGSSYTQSPETKRESKTSTTPICRSVFWHTFCITMTVAPYRIDLHHTFEKETLESRYAFFLAECHKTLSVRDLERKSYRHPVILKAMKYQ